MKTPLLIIKEHEEINALDNELEELQKKFEALANDFTKQKEEIWGKIKEALIKMGKIENEDAFLSVRDGVLYMIEKNSDLINEKLDELLEKLKR